MEWSQADRPFRIETPLGPDALLLVSWEGTEEISTLFRYTVVAWSRKSDIHPSTLLLKNVSLNLRLPDGSSRKINGIVSRFARGGIVAEGHTSYMLEIVPPHWALSLDHGFDIFQNKTSREICDKMLQGTPHEWRLVRTLDPRPYCFRYRESRWNVVSRLIEQEGIWYRFDNSGSEAKLVLGDSTASAREAWGVLEIVYNPDSVGSSFSSPFVTELHSEANPYTALTRVRTATEFLTTNNILEEISGASTVFSPPPDLEWYDFAQQLAAHHSGISHSGGDTPSDAAKFQPDVKVYSRIQQERSESCAMRFLGKSRYVGLETGAKAIISGANDHGFNGPVFITRVEHRGSNGSYVSDSVEAFYDNSFEAIPAATAFRPRLRAQWPRVNGSHVGTVTGPEGEEIHTDKHGRVQVVFKWDRANDIGLERSCWIRVAQPFAGQQFGMVFLPRIGHEVIVDFLDGNPDNPVVVGSLYNNVNMPPWPLPTHKTQSGVRTKSTLNGGADNHNELRFEDTKGKEQIWVQAERDLDSLVKRNETRVVQNDRTTIVGNNETRTVKEGFDHTIVEKGEQVVRVLDNNREIYVAKNHSSLVDGDEAIAIGGNRDLVISKDQSHEVKGNDFTVVRGNRETTIIGDEDITIEEGNTTIEAKLGNVEATASVGNIKVEASAGNVAIEAFGKIDLKVGANQITIDPSGVTIKGLMIKVSGTASTSIKAPMVQVNGDAMLGLKGAITLIN